MQQIDCGINRRAVLGKGHDPFAEAHDFLDTLFRRLLEPAVSPPGKGA